MNNWTGREDEMTNPVFVVALCLAVLLGLGLSVGRTVVKRFSVGHSAVLAALDLRKEVRVITKHRGRPTEATLIGVDKSGRRYLHKDGQPADQIHRRSEDNSRLITV